MDKVRLCIPAVHQKSVGSDTGIQCTFHHFKCKHVFAFEPFDSAFVGIAAMMHSGAEVGNLFTAALPVADGKVQLKGRVRVGIVQGNEIDTIDQTMLFIAPKIPAAPLDLFAALRFDRIVDDQYALLAAAVQRFDLSDQRGRADHQKLSPVVAGLLDKAIIGVFAEGVTALFHKSRLAFVHHQHVDKVQQNLKRGMTDFTLDKVALLENLCNADLT